MTARGQDRVLLVEDDPGLGSLLADELDDAGFRVSRVQTAEQAWEKIRAWSPALVVTDLRLPGADGLELLRNARAELGSQSPDFLVITAFGSVAKAVECLKSGAEDFLTKPLDLEHFRLSVRRILERRAMRLRIMDYELQAGSDAVFHGLIGRCPAMLVLFDQIRELAQARGPVLIHGESGTGKELVARAIHQEGPFAAKPFIAINCAAIPEALLESEFFGHQAGAFTGASKPRKGLVAEAEGGALFLDEISEMPLALQAKLLRVLEDGWIRPVGANREQQVNVRILAATHRDLEEQVRSEAFREDLFFRLETFPLSIPPLRERGDDIDILSGVFLRKFATASGKSFNGIHSEALALLHDYGFPGNVRELQNAIERAVVVCSGREIRSEHLPARIRKRARRQTVSDAAGECGFPFMGEETLPSLDVIEQRYIRHVMQRVDGNKRLAASVLGLARRTLYRRLEEMGDSAYDL